MSLKKMYRYNNIKIKGAWSHADGIKFPRGWVDGATTDQLIELGVETLDNPIRPAIDGKSQRVVELPSGEFEIIDFTVDEKVTAYTAAINKLINDTAKSKGYDDINSIGKYIGYDNAYRVEAESLGAWVAGVWVKISEINLAWLSGGQEPTFDEILSQLPLYKDK